MMDTYHVVPINDLIDHDRTPDCGDCVCIPRAEPFIREDGSCGWLIVHHSLDGREQREARCT